MSSRRFGSMHIWLPVLLLLVFWASGTATVSASEPSPETTLPVYAGGVPANQVKPLQQAQFLQGAGSLGSSQPGTDVNASNLVGNESEVSIDVNPTNANNQVIAGHAPNFATMNTFFSIDGGATWSLVALGNAQDGLTSTFRFDPAVAFDDNGNVYAAYGVRTAATGGGNQRSVVVCQSTDGGATYPQCTIVATTADIGTLPGNDKWMLATGPDPFIPTQQNVYIAWTQNVTETGGTDQRIVVSGSTDGGTTFSAPLIINDPSISGRRSGNLFADPAVGPNGELYVAWHDINAGQVFVDVSLDGGTTFGTDSLVTASGASFKTLIPPQPDRGTGVAPTIDTDRSGGPFDGRLYVTYVDLGSGGSPDMDIYVRFSNNGGATWSARTLVNDDGGTNSQFLPWLDVDQQTGAVSVDWYDARNDTNNQMVETFMAVSIDGGVTFQPNILVSDGQSDQSTNNPNRTGNNYLEYIGIASFDCDASLVWADNSTNLADLDYFTDQVHLQDCEATINVVKEVDEEPDGAFDDDPTGWTFDVDNDGQPSQVTGGTGLLTFNVSPGTYSVNETAGPSGLWLVSADCKDDTSGAAVGTGVTDTEFESPTTVGVTGVALSMGQSVTCTFSNEKDEAVVNIVKRVDAQPDGVFDDDPAGWTFDVFDDGEPNQTTDSTGMLTFVVRSDTYNVRESSQPASDTGLWLVTASCVDDSDSTPVGTGVTDVLFGPSLPSVDVLDLNLVAGQSVTCTFDNQKMAGFLTGGGNITKNKGRNALRITFGGNVGVALDGSFHGQWQTNFHRVSNPNLSGASFHSTSIDSIVFGNVVGEEPDPPDAVFNSVEFVTIGRLDGQVCQLTVIATDHGEPARGKNAGNDSDSIQFIVDCPDNNFDYDSASDFSKDEGDLHNLDGGNLQIHSPAV